MKDTKAEKSLDEIMNGLFSETGSDGNGEGLWPEGEPLVFSEEAMWFHQMYEAIEKRRYTTLYAKLRKPIRELATFEAFTLCEKALMYKLTVRAIGAILDCSPPLEQVLNSKGLGRYNYGLVELAASQDRVDILDLLLRRGGNVNRAVCPTSPLEAAVESHALGSVERLLQEPELDVTLTPRLLGCWSQGGMGQAALDFCLQAVSPRLLGKEPSFQDPIPIPDQLTVVHAARAENWRLLCRLCREREVSFSEGGRALKAIPMHSYREEEEIINQAAALDSLFTACPDLLRKELAVQLLVYYALWHQEKTWETLEPWVVRIQNRHMRLDKVEKWSTSLEREESLWKLLRRWQTNLPNGPRPAIDRHTGLRGGWGQPISADLLEFVLQTCVFLPKRRPEPGQVSDLASNLLCCGRPKLIEEQFQPGKVLAGEDPDTLLQFCQQRECPKLSQGLILTHIKKEDRYEL